jgi:hypothetical protein
MLRRLLIATLAVIGLLPSQGQAAKVKVWHHHTLGHYEKAQFNHTVLSNEGALRLARQLRPLATLEATHVWDVVEDHAGNLLVATGDEGKIFKVAPDGTITVAYTSEDSQVLCLALAQNGTVYAGTGPSGRLMQIAPDGKARVLFQSPESYVWCLAIDPATQTVYAGTGPKGRIYEVTSQGKPRVFYTTKQDHILALARGADGLLYAGTDRDGLIYRIDARGKGFVLYSTPQSEVRSLLVTSDGVYAGTGSPTRRRGGVSSASGGSRTSAYPSGGMSSISLSSGRERARTALSESKASSSAGALAASEESADKSAGAPAAAVPTVGENSLYHIAPDGAVRELFRERAMLLSLLRQDGRLFIGTGMDGQLFEVDETTKERSELARLDHGQIQCLRRRHDGSMVLGTGDPGKLYALQNRYAAHGTVLSDILDAKLISKWGSLRWRADVPAGTSVSVSLRSGNTPEPDGTWSDWSAEQTDAEQATIAAPTARFLQYRVTLATTDPARTPTVHSVALRYMTTNQAPEITSIIVPDLDAVNLDNPKKLKFRWTATDPNEDELAYDVYIRKDGWDNWVLLEEELDRTEYEWDTTTTPSGLYRIKIVASDRKDNGPQECLSSKRISQAFAVAHEAPTVTIKVAGKEGDKLILEAKAVDPLVRLTSASYALNGKKWINLFPSDGLFDSKMEMFRIKTDALKPGTYVVVLRVRDAAGNTGSGDVVFTVPNDVAR